MARPYIEDMALEGRIPNRFLAIAATQACDWEAVYRAELPRVYNFFRYRFGNEAVAEDLTSRTFEKAWVARRRYRRDLAGFSTWLLSIARNVAIDHLRAARPHAPLEAAAAVSVDRTPEDEQARASDLAHLSKLIASLPRREQELISLKYGAEATNREIAKVTGLSESNVGTILHRAVASLRQLW